MTKRAFFAALALGSVALAMGQSNFTIVKPSDGAKVRETVRILFPKSSIGANNYVGIYIGGKFLEAVVPQMGQQFAYYELDTKERGFADGPLTVEAVLFADFTDRPRIIDRSSIQLNIANSASIPVPTDGFKLQYKFRRGQQWSYSVRQRISSVALSEALANQATRGSLLAGAEEERFRLLYAVDNAYGNGDGLVRIQGQADKGKDSVVLSLDSDPQPTRYYDFQMAPLYMRLSPDGREVFGAIPRYFPLSGTAGELSRLDLYANFPLPTLPAGNRRPGDVFNGRFMLGELNLEKADEISSITSKNAIPARGDFVGVEWEMGHPCARIRQTLATSAPTTGRGGASGPALPEGAGILRAQKIEEEIYFALDLGMPVKVERTYTIDVRQQIQRQASNQGAAGGGGGGGGIGVAGTQSGAASIGGGGGGRINRVDPPENLDIQGPQRPPNRGGQAGGQAGGPAGIGGNLGGPPGPPGRGGAGNRPPGRSGGSGQTSRILRVTVQFSMTLEK